ncbi:hypothetical protein AVEN_90556-1 [Araneus ventricosus]|uniref:Uncharacterized protein n=1 Tax=Araneus ventricosus TaxID=182803 RepID=A0A4Y2UF80_ARAVE|nr:hypothetical protein AVEN_90556-1 [Araneus ventricosus]
MLEPSIRSALWKVKQNQKQMSDGSKLCLSSRTPGKNKTKSKHGEEVVLFWANAASTDSDDNLKLSSSVSLIVAKRYLQRFYGRPGRNWKPLTPDLVDKMKKLESSRIMVISLIGAEIRISQDDSM